MIWGHIDTPLINEPSAGVVLPGEYTLECHSLLFAVLLGQEYLHLDRCVFRGSQHHERAQVIRTTQKLENRPHTRKLSPVMTLLAYMSVHGATNAICYKTRRLQQYP